MPRTTAAAAPQEKMVGETPYLDFLAALHEKLRPRHYIEIGVRHGASLRLAQDRATGVDPAPEITTPLPAGVQICNVASDQYFADFVEGQVFDFGFIDGLHLFEQALRDFINIERHARPGAALVIDDIFPNHPAQAQRDRITNAWTGDVWKLAEVLSRCRGDLFMASFDTFPTGSLLVAGLDPANRLLSERYDEIVQAFAVDAEPPSRVLERRQCLSLLSGEGARAIEVLAECYRHALGPADTVARLRLG